MSRTFTDTTKALALRGERGWTRKAAAWSEIDSVLPDHADLSGLPVYDAAEIGVGRFPCSDFTRPPEHTVFILKNHPRGAFVINTEGGGYARYAARVPAYHPMLAK
jgi:hypothetical protein